MLLKVALNTISQIQQSNPPPPPFFKKNGSPTPTGYCKQISNIHVFHQMIKQAFLIN
jgi:hypothetical protein